MARQFCKSYVELLVSCTVERGSKIVAAPPSLREPPARKLVGGNSFSPLAKSPFSRLLDGKESLDEKDISRPIIMGRSPSRLLDEKTPLDEKGSVDQSSASLGLFSSPVGIVLIGLASFPFYAA
jgi:hypothetical protein